MELPKDIMWHFQQSTTMETWRKFIAYSWIIFSKLKVRFKVVTFVFFLSRLKTTLIAILCPKFKLI